MEKLVTKNNVTVQAFKGDAMTLLAFNLEGNLKNNLAGFTIRYGLKNSAERHYIYNRLTFPASFRANSAIPEQDKNSTLYSPIQKFNWVHVPNTNIDTQEPVFGDYIYEVTPRYIVNGKLLEITDDSLTVTVPINVSPYDFENTKIGFTRGFVSSVAYAKRFNVDNNSVRPKTNDTLLFDITKKADTASRWNDVAKKFENVSYTFEEQHKWLGWQARNRIIEFLDTIVDDTALKLNVLAYDLNEPEICKRLLLLAGQGRLQIILDDEGKHGLATSMESIFESTFRQQATNGSRIERGNYSGLAHCKVFIALDSNNVPLRVLTGSTNFSTNGIYINSNHVLVFEDDSVASLYNDVFLHSLGKQNMDSFKGTEYTTKDYEIGKPGLPKMTITFAPHPKADAERIFKRISDRIAKKDNTDVLFAIMNDGSESSILKAVREQLKNEKIFTYGITDRIGEKDEDYKVYLYKPNSKKGIRVAARGISNILPKPFGEVAGIDGYAIHHKFVVVNFRGEDPVVYCGSSNLAFGPEQKNGDNLLEIHDKNVATVFAIEALRLVDHFHWRNNELKKTDEMELDDLSSPSKAWYLAWFDVNDLKNKQRLLYVS